MALVLALHAGNLEHAQRIVSGARDQISALSVLDDVLAPAMHDIGSLWEQAEISVADEHLATSVAHRLLATVAPALAVAPPKTRERILLATPAHECHTTGLLMAADVLHGAGYDTLVLGAGLPDSELVPALERHQPAIVAFSLTMPVADAFAETAAMVHEVLPTAQVLTGGAANPNLPWTIAAHHLERLDGLLAVVDALLAAQRN
jgi:methanogenic corrinoid protein MtbC1